MVWRGDTRLSSYDEREVFVLLAFGNNLEEGALLAVAYNKLSSTSSSFMCLFFVRYLLR
jgi:hypothetical protein